MLTLLTGTTKAPHSAPETRGHAEECVEGKGAMWGGAYRDEACRGGGVQGVQRERGVWLNHEFSRREAN